MDTIAIRGARTHNLKDISLELPRDKLIVITGLSGSGKSSLAFDTIYAEGQRRYVESLSTYARQFLSMMEKPDMDHIEGLSPAISIEQKSTSHNPRSTVGTITEIYDYLRLLFARVGEPRCPDHGINLEAQTVSQMVDAVLALPEGSKLMLLAPVVRERKGEHLHVFEELRAGGFVRARVDGIVTDLDTEDGAVTVLKNLGTRLRDAGLPEDLAYLPHVERVRRAHDHASRLRLDAAHVELAAGAVHGRHDGAGVDAPVSGVEDDVPALEGIAETAHPGDGGLEAFPQFASLAVSGQRRG